MNEFINNFLLTCTALTMHSGISFIKYICFHIILIPLVALRWENFHTPLFIRKNINNNKTVVYITYLILIRPIRFRIGYFKDLTNKISIGQLKFININKLFLCKNSYFRETLIFAIFENIILAKFFFYLK